MSFEQSYNQTIAFIQQDYVALYSAGPIWYARIIGSRIESDLANQYICTALLHIAHTSLENHSNSTVSAVNTAYAVITEFFPNVWRSGVTRY